MPEPINPDQMKVLELIAKHRNLTEAKIRSMLKKPSILREIQYLSHNGLIIEVPGQSKFPAQPWKPIFSQQISETEYRISHLGQRVVQEAWRGR